MSLLYQTRRHTPQMHQRTTSTNFCQLFAQETRTLYLLSLLLTADPGLAEECVMSSLDDCLNGVAVAAGREHAWARRSVVKNAIRLIGPDLLSATTGARQREQGYYQEHPTIRNVFALRDFERIVFVLSVLEQYPDRDCAALLGCVAQEIKDTRTQALRRVAGF
jgi:hypothetical protein